MTKETLLKEFRENFYAYDFIPDFIEGVPVAKSFESFLSTSYDQIVEEAHELGFHEGYDANLLTRKSIKQVRAETLEEVREKVEGMKVNISEKVEATGGYKFALMEVRKHEQSYNQALTDILNALKTMQTTDETMQTQ